MLPPAHSPEELAAWLGGKAAGSLVTSGNTLRAIDMLELPLAGNAIEGIVGLFAGAAAHELDELGLEAEMGFPKLAVVDILDWLPGAQP